MSLLFSKMTGRLPPPDVPPDTNAISGVHAVHGEIVHPWSDTGTVDTAEEDIEPPCLFTEPLHFMETSHSEALQEYRNLFESHVSTEMRSHTNVIDLLLTKGVKVFVPHNWDGVRGIDPIEFTWIDDMPNRIMPRVRPINPKLFKNAKAEFERLQGYFFSSLTITDCLASCYSSEGHRTFLTHMW
jgi:hypothetical protein